MWRLAVCVVAVGVLALPTVFVYLIWLDDDDDVDTQVICLSWVVMGIIVITYSLAQRFLVTEEFISVRSLPVGAYSVVCPGA